MITEKIKEVTKEIYWCAHRLKEQKIDKDYAAFLTCYQIANKFYGSVGMNIPTVVRKLIVNIVEEVYR